MSQRKDPNNVLPRYKYFGYVRSPGNGYKWVWFVYGEEEEDCWEWLRLQHYNSEVSMVVLPREVQPSG